MSDNHGAQNAYRQGCRCDLCRRHNTERQKTWRYRRRDITQPNAVTDASIPQLGNWRDQGACKGHPQEWWFDDERNRFRRARQICATCPVQLDCLRYALQFPHGDIYGIWGGLNQQERRNLHKGTAS